MRTFLLLFFSFPLFCFSVGKTESLFQKKDISNAGEQSLVIYPDDSSKRKENPVIPGDFADPSIIRHGDIYYASGTSSEWAPHYPLFQSTDLLHWQLIGYIFNQTPSWAAA